MVNNELYRMWQGLTRKDHHKAPCYVHLPMSSCELAQVDTEAKEGEEANGLSGKTTPSDGKCYKSIRIPSMERVIKLRTTSAVVSGGEG